MGKYSDQLGGRLRGRADPFPEYRTIAEFYALALKIIAATPEETKAILMSQRGKSDEEHRLRDGLKLLAKSAGVQLDVAEKALLKLDEAMKLRLVPDVGQS
jgi:hypothetical protein